MMRSIHRLSRPIVGMTYATFSQEFDISRGSLSSALRQLQSTYEAAQAVSVVCQGLSRISPVLQPCIASDGKSALATLLASAHVPPRTVTADDVQVPSSPKYIDQEPWCFSFQCTSRRCSVLSVQHVNYYFESTWDETKTHRHNRLIFKHHMWRLLSSI
jgi:hypothetical protein